MSRKVRKGTAIYAFLDDLGLLENGTAEEIAAAKKEYYRQLKREYKKRKSANERPFEIFLNSSELSHIAALADRLNMSRTRYIKEAALAYSMDKYLVPNTDVIYAIKDLLALNYSALEDLLDEKIVPASAEKRIIEQMADMEERICSLLFKPVMKNAG